MARLPMTFRNNTSQYRILLLLDAMEERAKSAEELAAECFIHRSRVNEYLTHIGARISHYGPATPGHRTIYYDMKPGRSTRRPSGLTQTEHNRLTWNRIKANPDRHDKYNAKRRAARLKPKRDIAAFWI